MNWPPTTLDEFDYWFRVVCLVNLYTLDPIAEPPCGRPCVPGSMYCDVHQHLDAPE